VKVIKKTIYFDVSQQIFIFNTREVEQLIDTKYVGVNVKIHFIGSICIYTFDISFDLL